MRSLKKIFDGASRFSKLVLFLLLYYVDFCCYILKGGFWVRRREVLHYSVCLDLILYFFLHVQVQDLLDLGAEAIALEVAARDFVFTVPVLGFVLGRGFCEVEHCTEILMTKLRGVCACGV